MAVGATARGLAALLVSLVRQPGFEFNSNDKAMLMATQRGHQYVNDAIEAITRRAELIAGPEAAEEVKQQLKRKMDLWQKRAQRTAQGNQLARPPPRQAASITAPHLVILAGSGHRTFTPARTLFRDGPRYFA